MSPINTEIRGIIGLIRPIIPFRLRIRRKIIRLMGSLIHVVLLNQNRNCVQMKFTILILCFCISSCSITSSKNEVGRLTDPSGTIDAVIIEINGGATTSFTYDVMITTKGSNAKSGNKVATLYGATRNESAYGVNLKWISNKVLSIEYFDTKSVKSQKDDVTINGNKIQVILKDGIWDKDAPSGGMLYNLNKMKNSTTTSFTRAQGAWHS